VLQAGHGKAAGDGGAGWEVPGTLQGRAGCLEEEIQARIRESRESEAQLMSFIRHANAAIAFKDLEGRFLLVNPKMEEKIGLPAAEILHRANESLFPESVCVPLRERDRGVLEGKVAIQYEEAWPVRGSNAKRHYLSTKFPLLDGTGRCWGLGLIETDITASKDAELAMLQSQKLESLGVLTGGIAHDFNNFLAAIRGNAELALTEPDADQVKVFLNNMMEVIQRAADLVGQMLIYSGKGSCARLLLDLNRLVGDLVHLLRHSISKKATINLDLAPHSLWILADPTKVQQVVMNLVINASEALEERIGTVTIRTREENLDPAALQRAFAGQELRPGAYVVLEVSDNGKGMAPETLKRIFDPFFTTKFTGRGLGLSAVSGILRNHQGAVQVFSDPGLGSTFRLVFPARPELASEGGAGTPEPAGADSAPQAVLVVDDEEPLRRLVGHALGRAGIRALMARDGREALEILERKGASVGVIVLDLTMPDLGGEETCRELRRRGIQVPVILTSGFHRSDVLPRFKDLNIAEFLPKPFELSALVRLVRVLLARSGR
jgi:PAS domain S-box-containing protein